MKVMLLAAGEGRRLQPFTLETPKPAIPFLTAPLASFSLSLLEKMQVSKLVVNTHHLPQKIENLFHWTKLPTKNLVFSSETDLLLGSGGGIHKAKAHLLGAEPFMVMNSDEVILPKKWGLLQEMLEFHRWHKGIATLLTMNHPEVGTKFGGAWTAKNQTLVQQFSKTKTDDQLQGHHFIGIMILEPRVFKFFKDNVEVENILYETLTKAMAAGEQVHTFTTDCEWFETGNPEDFLKAADACSEALLNGPDQVWTQFLAQTLRVYGEGKLLIENSNPKLKAKIKSAFEKQTIRLDEF